MSDSEILIRLVMATFAGMALGLDRELRGISAGIRTHGLVALSSAVITISAMLLFYALRAEDGASTVDPLRVIQGLAQAIGFIAAGTIFFAKGDVHNLTSAANLWLAAALGIVAGLGQYLLFGAALFIGAVLISVVRLIERFLPGKSNSRRPPHQ